MRMQDTKHAWRTATWLALVSIGYYMLLIVLTRGRLIEAESTIGANSFTASDSLIVLLLAITVYNTYRIVTCHVASVRTKNRDFQSTKPGTEEVTRLALSLGRKLPRFIILVPAKEETRVIRNTMQRLSQLEYPKELYRVIVITDERESLTGNLTTRSLAEEQARKLNKALGSDTHKVIDVPCDFNGCLDQTKKSAYGSTKGRALNYALKWIEGCNSSSLPDMVCVLDADGRLHHQALASASLLVMKENARIIQGPVLQISNLLNADLVGIMAGIELSLFHMSRMWLDLTNGREYPRFLAGTNYFVDPRLLFSIGGWDCRSLVEDADLGLRLFIENRTRTFWLPCYEVEQTPPKWQFYLRQRERWALGHLQLLATIASSKLSLTHKIHLVRRIVTHIGSSLIDISLPITLFLFMKSSSVMTMPLVAGITWLLWFASVYTWSQTGRGLALLNEFATSPMSHARVFSSALLLVFCTPALIILKLIPRMTALSKYANRAGICRWYKTDRSIEDSVHSSLITVQPR
jgi:cellulose synthase/poly-beta-1,6-N-acetylglucosamine synthase-like glycosyltransferase